MATGSGLRSLDDVAVSLTDAEHDSIREELGKRARAQLALPLDNEELLSEARLAASLLPDRLLRALRRFRRHGNSAGAMLIRNMPIDSRLPATPQDGYLGHWSELPVTTYAQLTVASVVGDIIAYADEKAGNLIQEIVPIKGAEARQENSGTVYLELHTENGFHPNKPDFITLFCLRPDHAKNSHTLVGAVAEVLPTLSAECVATLRRPQFRLRVSSSFGDHGTHRLTQPVAVISGAADSPEFLVDFHAMEPLTDDAGTALEELKRALQTSLRGVRLDAGDLLVIDNRVAVHGRTPFAAVYDETDRWLRRCFAVSDIRRSQRVRAPGSRVCDPLNIICFSLYPADASAAGPHTRAENQGCITS
ncbi:L-asparagine oxygenase [Saccharothrix tamanrassetensis]|uniref:L-asparagine oxygenase n=1 Tax=Saccharothrix tamanrassetensis TaxID=1051531 RepID=A0A841CQW8_9PSEU|nr:TauD/TfdA family dioxygenase [Saccharothrix tamanrassetensis]MBB5959620.1 L-asparagine oxygenase [Saccharothrix tamanrassetensis]